jgi:ribosomal protein S18 acetylase RimI-like enzyme
VARDDTPISYRNCLVAADAATGSLVGAANVFPADLLRDERYGLLPPGRAHHIEPMMKLQDFGSMFVNALAVADSYRGQGIGGRLLAWAEERARAAGMDRVSLHVWADNVEARALYGRQGFVDVATAAVAPHPRLPHVGGSILMHKRLGAQAASP